MLPILGFGTGENSLNTVTDFNVKERNKIAQFVFADLCEVMLQCVGGLIPILCITLCSYS